MWTGLNISMGLGLGVVGFFSTQVVLRAAVATVCLVGALSAVGVVAPTGTYRYLQGPLSVGLGLMVGAGIGQMIWYARSCCLAPLSHC
jgi:hypothetical protein